MKINKVLIFGFLFGIVSTFGLSVIAQDNSGTGTGAASGQQIARETNLGDVVMRFCNDTGAAGGTKTLELKTETNKPEEICMYLENKGPTTVKVGVNFVDGTTTSDEDNKKACEPDGTVTNFGQYVTRESTGFILTSKLAIQTKATVKFPDGIAGKVNGCVTYQILSDGTGEQSGMFKVISRRANFIDVIVSGSAIFKIDYVAENNPSFPNIGNSENITLYLHPIAKMFSLKSFIVNTGNIESLSTISGSIDARFGRIHEELTSRQIKVPAKQKSVYEYELPWRAEYGGPVVVSLHTSDLPQLPEGVHTDNPNAVMHDFTTSAFLLPSRVMRTAGALLLLILYRIKRWASKK